MVRAVAQRQGRCGPGGTRETIQRKILQYKVKLYGMDWLGPEILHLGYCLSVKCAYSSDTI